LDFEIHTERHGAVVVLTIDNPPVNALHPDVAAELHRRLRAAGDDPTIRALVLTGAGRHFGAGGDIEHFRTLDSHRAERYVLGVQAMQDEIGLLPQPVIAAINGTCLGGGAELAMACDIRIADERAIFGQPEVTLGIIPGAGGTQRLPRLIATGRAKRLLFTGDRIGAAEALELGLVDEVTPAGETVSAARALAERIARNAPLAVAAAKRAVNLGLQMGVVDAHRLEATLFAQLAGTRDFVEGVSAFFDKREPAFTRE